MDYRRAGIGGRVYEFAISLTKAVSDDRVTGKRETRFTLDDLLRQLDALTGLVPVKAQVRQLVDMVRMEQIRCAAGLPVPPAGTWRSTGTPDRQDHVARLLGEPYAAIGILRIGQLVEAARSDLVAGYVGQTAIKTTEVVNRALGAGSCSSTRLTRSPGRERRARTSGGRRSTPSSS